MNKTIQAKHIPDDDVLAVVRRPGYKSPHTVAQAMPDIPFKVVLAKCNSMMKRKLIEGCPCGCSSPIWELDPNGKHIIR